MKEVTNFLPNCPTVCSLYETMGLEKKMAVHLKTMPLFLGTACMTNNLCAQFQFLWQGTEDGKVMVVVLLSHPPKDGILENLTT